MPVGVVAEERAGEDVVNADTTPAKTADKL
jgi:hypothetical protein